MADARNAVASRDSHIWSLRMALMLTSLVVIVLIYVIYDRQKNQKVHVPPDTSHGAVLTVGELQPANAYSFAYITWSKINEWRESGKEDYTQKIEQFDCFITPRFRTWLKKDRDNKDRLGELSRQRVFGARGFYKPTLAKKMGDGFVVGLEVDVMEEINREVFKTRAIYYPMAVVADNRSCNTMGMALDGFYSKPYQIKETTDE